jgi:hypothetical protein
MQEQPDCVPADGEHPGGHPSCPGQAGWRIVLPGWLAVPAFWPCRDHRRTVMVYINFSCAKKHWPGIRGQPEDLRAGQRAGGSSGSVRYPRRVRVPAASAQAPAVLTTE